jgi:hypothetical protein
MSCFILKRSITGAVYSINDNGKAAIVAFATKKQAGTYRRLINEVNNRKHNNQLKTERIPVDNIKGLCSMSALDLVIFDKHHNTMVYKAEVNATDEIRFHLENQFKSY